MLVLQRKEKQKVIITTPEGRVIEVYLVRVYKDKRARIGFVLDKDISIEREERLTGVPDQSSDD